MPRANLASRSVPRTEIDQRVRDTRLRLQRLERLIVPHAALQSSWLKRVPCLFSFGRYGNGIRGHRARGPLRRRRPSSMPQIRPSMIGACGPF